MRSLFSSKTLRAFAASAVTVVALTACSSSDSVVAPQGPGAAAKLELSTNGIALANIGAADTVKATLRDAAGNVTTGAVAWSSANPAVADVDGSGAITARAAGSTIVTATSGSFSAEIEVRVFGVRSIALAQSAVALRVGDDQSVGAIIESDPSAEQGVRYSVENAAIATISAEGVISGITAGNTTITVTSIADPRLTASATVSVNPARAVSFAPGGSAITLWNGDARTLSADVDVDANESKDIIWSSGNTSVATIDPSGVITATGEGTAIVRATSAADPRAFAEIVVTVLPARSVTVAPDSVMLVQGGTRQLAATVTIESGLNTDVTWSSSDTNVVTVSATGEITAVASGYVGGRSEPLRLGLRDRRGLHDLGRALARPVEA
jgi:uncharacterized protein YjdB